MYSVLFECCSEIQEFISENDYYICASFNTLNTSKYVYKICMAKPQRIQIYLAK